MFANAGLRRDFRRVLLATLCFGAAGGIFQSTLNNYLSDVHRFGAEARGWLELPRELPGFLMIFIAGALLLRMRETQMAALAMIFSAAGALGLGFLSEGTALLIAWVVIWSLGDHIIFTVEGPIGLKLARRGGEGHRLGQLGGARNLGQILGVAAVYVVARLAGDRYGLFYLLAATAALAAGLLYRGLRIGSADPPSRRWVWRRRYRLFYAISALFGIRKQLFLVFGGWVLVSLHGVPVSTIALLYFIAATLGVVMRPLLGDVIDRLGERLVLAADEIILLAICLVYAFADIWLPAPHALRLLCAAYVLDNVLFALRVARTTYLQKIALDAADITPTLSVGLTIDHAVAMTLPVFSGYVWEAWGFRWVFVIAAAVALAGFLVCLQIRTPTVAAGTAGAPARP